MPGIDEDIVRELQATDMLWNPLAGPALRGACTRCSRPRPAWSSTRTPGTPPGGPRWKSAGSTRSRVDDQTFENRATGAVLETAFSYPRDRAESPGMGLYRSVTGSNTLPPDPYDH